MGKKALNFRVDEELFDKLDELQQTLGKNRTDTFIHLLETYIGRDSNQYEFLDTACPAIQHLEDGFHCCFKVPRAKPWKLGDGGQDDARKICSSCKMMEPYREAQRQLDKLRKSGYTVDIPYCSRGGKVRENLKTIWCPKSGDDKSITYCQKCDFYRVIHADARLAASTGDRKK